MHRSTPSSSQHGGGLFKNNIFGNNRRPSTGGGLKDKEKERDTYFAVQVSSEPVPASLGPQTSSHGRFDSTTATNTTSSPEKRGLPVQGASNRPAVALDSRTDLNSRTADENLPQQDETSHNSYRAARRDSFTSILPFSNMLVRPGTSYSAFGATGGGPGIVPASLPSPTLENITYLHIQETSSKRISTLDYLRKAHEGRVYWFNTLLFNKPDLQRMPYFDTRKLARRATNYLLLGLSLPTVLDLNSANPTEFLRTLNALLTEFESFQSIHPPDGSSSLSRARFPQMFKRAATGAGKGRRTSSAADIGLPMGNDSSDSKATNDSATSFTMGETDLLPGEEYTHLLTPSLPFDPDFYETFATLCDVLIDCYTRLMTLVSGPRDCSPYVAEMFTKADARVRKIIVQGVVKEFEDGSRAGVKGEVAGVGRVVLGGLM